MKQPLPQSWDLDRYFVGGSNSPAYLAFLDETDVRLEALRQQVTNAESIGLMESADVLAAIAEQVQTLSARNYQALSFAECLIAQNSKDKKANQRLGRVQSTSAAFATEKTRLDALLAATPDEAWARLMQDVRLKPIAFPLSERRALAREKLSPELEAIINDLSVDGYHGWGEAYGTAVSKTQIPFEEKDGTVRQLSAGQAHNQMLSPDRSVRKRVFEAWEAAWGGQADYCADALNRLGGFRLQVYKHRKWESVLKEPLQINRMTERTFHAMWEAIEASKPIFVDYLNRKAKLMGLEKLSWFDVHAPIAETAAKVPYDQGAAIIVEQFAKFDPAFAEFSRKAFEDRWIEAEDRPGKRPGGFCTGFPLSGETRIFMTYNGTMDNVSTLAHELGHAYHQHVMDDMPEMTQHYAMNVAETASTFAEQLVMSALVANAESKQDQIALLDEKISSSIAFFMNIHARVLFELSFYEQRRQGLVPVETLNQLMESAQRKAYLDALDQYHPHFWASKLHFYATDVPFYNFPYTFGYLFSTVLYARALQEGEAFRERYVALLRDTGSMSVEELVHKHLQEDPSEPAFWQKGVELAAADVKQFLQLTE